MSLKRVGSLGVVVQPEARDHGPFILPRDHVPAIRVPQGGSSCANCAWAQVRPDGPHCVEPRFALWNKGTRLPVDDPSTYCSDWYEPAPGTLAR